MRHKSTDAESAGSHDPTITTERRVAMARREFMLLSLASLSGMPLSFIEVPSSSAQAPAVASPMQRAQVKAVKLTILSDNLVSTTTGKGEWGFAGLFETDGRRILLDTGSHSDTVLENARYLKIDLSDIKEVVLTHSHWDHVRGFIALRRTIMKTNPEALSIAYVARGIFYSRPGPSGERNEMVALRKEYEATGGKFIEHDTGAEIFPGIWLTGPVPRVYPERNWSVLDKVQTPDGLVEDTVPEDQSVVLNTRQGLVVLTGCGHAGIINILTYACAQFPNQPVEAIIGGLHLFAATDEQLNWTGDKLKEFRVANLVGTHCTGLEALYRLRERAGLTRKTAVVGGVGARYVLGEGIRPGAIAR